MTHSSMASPHHSFDRDCLESAYNQAYTLDLAQLNASSYTPPIAHVAAILPEPNQQLMADQQQPLVAEEPAESHEDSTVAAVYPAKRNCFFCGSNFIHVRKTCPARNASCNKCRKKGHFAKVCRSKMSESTVAALYSPTLLTIPATFPQNLSHAATHVTVNGHPLKALIDSCSSDSFIRQTVAQRLNLPVCSTNKEISMASVMLNAISPG